MNERIIELAKQAGLELSTVLKDYVTPVKSITIEQRKFAELIVRECAKFLEDNSGYDDSNNAWHPEPEDMLKHFGVEE
jgi:hypothetical protein